VPEPRPASEGAGFLASCPRGLADLLAQELVTLGAQEVRERSTGVGFQGPLEVAYRACLWSRTANRVFLVVAVFEAGDAEALYAAARRIDWAAHIGPAATLACEWSGAHPTITHTHFGALKLKDAIVDQLRESAGHRPDVERERPDVRVHAHSQGTRVTLSIDLSGESLHRRGYRGAAGEAPLKENVAAGVLLRAGWPALAAEGGALLDPLCGSGTFVIEAALMAADIAPGLGREYFGFLGWRGHDAAVWERVRGQAQARRDAGLARPAERPLRGQDRDSAALRAAQANARRAGIAERVQFRHAVLAEAEPAPGQAGLVCTNPPYGVRLEDEAGARALHRELGAILRERFQGWQAAVITAPQMGLELGIRARRTHAMWNGAIECRLLRLTIESASFREPGARRGLIVDETLRDTAGARMFANRLAKNLKRLNGWAGEQGVEALRLYDADMPEYALAIDRYRVVDDAQATAASGDDWLYVQEYEAPGSIDPEAVKRRRGEALSVLPGVTGVPIERIRLRLRRKQSGAGQYRKLESQAVFHHVREPGWRTSGPAQLSFWVNFDDYLDTGLFLDHRLTRARLGRLAAGKRFLNLFAYTCTATVHAAAGGARASTSVDLSRTYLEWGRRNLELNGIARAPHELLQADCREWLQDAVRRRERYDLVFLDPPTFSNSKRMQGVLDVSRDHGALIDLCTQLLPPDGLLVFSTNAQRFRLDESLQERYAVTDISRATIPQDFERNPRIHRCWEIRPK